MLGNNRMETGSGANSDAPMAVGFTGADDGRFATRLKRWMRDFRNCNLVLTESIFDFSRSGLDT